MKLEDIIHHGVVIKLATLKTDAELVKQIQTQLSLLDLYPNGQWLDGKYGVNTDKALTEFCHKCSLNHKQIDSFDRYFAKKMLNTNDFSEPSKYAHNREQIYQKFLKAAAKGKEDYPTLLYKGIKNSPYQEQIKDYPPRLLQKPDGKNVVCAAPINTDFQPYPAVGKIPKIDEQGLNFLHPEITEACVCVGSFFQRELRVKWLGKNALHNDEFWSGSKIIPLIHLVSRLNTKSPLCDIDNCNIRGRDQQGKYRDLPLSALMEDVISYQNKLASSNSLGAMFKRFTSQLELENWLKKITGNQKLIFRGRYGENAFINQPELYDRTTGQTLLSSDPQTPQWQNNTISAYDLNRIMAMLGWHYYLPHPSKLPGAQWHSIESAIKIMGVDPARLIDLALAELGLQDQIESTVILSKLGNGATNIRKRTEAVYVALVQFVDTRPQKNGQPQKMIMLSMALRGARKLKPRDLNREVVELDARMAESVTEIVGRAIVGNLA